MYAWLTGGSICFLYICILLDLAVGVVVCNTSMLYWLGGPSALYICIVLDLAVGVAVCKASVLSWLEGSICLLYICIVLDLAVGVAVCKASMSNLLGGVDVPVDMPNIDVKVKSK